MKKNQSESWPKYLPYTQVAMGIIHPEWLFMSHFFEDPEDGAEKESQPPAYEPRNIRINIRSRRPR